MVELFLHYMKNIVVKAGLITVGVLAVVGILIFSLWILISPQSMATVSEKLGNYNFAVTCADLKYKYSDETVDLARCAEDSILSKDDSLIVEYCEQFVEKSDFDAVCRSRNEDIARNWILSSDSVLPAPDYRTYIIGSLAAAQYRSTGDLDKAMATAELGGKVECFTKLIVAVAEKDNKQDIEKIQTNSPLFAREYVKGVIDLLNTKK